MSVCPLAEIGFLCRVARLIGRGAQTSEKSSTDWVGHLVRMPPWGGGPGMSSWENSNL